MRRLLLVFLLLIAWALSADAMENVTGKVNVIYGSPQFDTQAGKYYLDVTLQNISKKENLEFPLRLCVTSLSQNRASVYQPDGINSDGFPYFLYMQDDQKFLPPGGSVGPRRIFFARIKPGKLNFTSIVQISTTENTIDSFVSALGTGNINAALKEMDDHAIKKYGDAFNTLIYTNPGFVGDFSNKTLVIITDVLAKYELRVMEEGIEIVYDVYLYKNSNGEWKIYKL